MTCLKEKLTKIAPKVYMRKQISSNIKNVTLRSAFQVILNKYGLNSQKQSSSGSQVWFWLPKSKFLRITCSTSLFENL